MVVPRTVPLQRLPRRLDLPWPHPSASATPRYKVDGLCPSQIGARYPEAAHFLPSCICRSYAPCSCLFFNCKTSPCGTIHPTLHLNSSHLQCCNILLTLLCLLWCSRICLTCNDISLFAHTIFTVVDMRFVRYLGARCQFSTRQERRPLILPRTLLTFT